MYLQSMHSIYSRANALFAFMLWVLAAVTFACFLSTTFADYSSKVEITVNNPRVRSIADYSTSSEKADLGMLDFSITGDFTKIFNWNVKQLFLYLVAEYESPENVSEKRVTVQQEAKYNVVPNAGYLRLGQAEGQAVVRFPATYTTKKN
uniref:Signal peptidase complex subunit 3 n=1 Tax=Angiostrongylus cantonensis TaxID=6313 RepID=A0A0K0DFQ4_ANGCA